MQKYDLRTVLSRPRGSVVYLPSFAPPLADEVAYLQALRAMLREMLAWCRRELVPSFVSVKAGLHRDAEPATWSALGWLKDQLVSVASGMVRRILNLTGRRHTDNFNAEARKTLGIDLAGVVRGSDLEPAIDQMAQRNAALIAGLADDLVTRIKARTITAVLNGETAAGLKRDLVDLFGISDRRAKVIARDQIAKTTSDLNRLRHQQAGVVEYIWRTSADERVRPRHAALDGRKYRYDEPTGAEQGLPPGQPIMCRCWARAVIEF